MGLGLIFGFGLNYLDVMSFYYLFIPTWFFTILVYTLLPGRYGAKKAYPEAEEKEEAYNELVDNYHQKLADEQPQRVKDTSLLSKILRMLALASLAVTLVLAGNVLWGSDGEAAYTANRDTFYYYGFICTSHLLCNAYWAMHRGKQSA